MALVPASKLWFPATALEEADHNEIQQTAPAVFGPVSGAHSWQLDFNLDGWKANHRTSMHLMVPFSFGIYLMLWIAQSGLACVEPRRDFLYSYVPLPTGQVRSNHTTGWQMLQPLAPGQLCGNDKLYIYIYIHSIQNVWIHMDHTCHEETVAVATRLRLGTRDKKLEKPLCAQSCQSKAFEKATLWCWWLA